MFLNCVKFFRITSNVVSWTKGYQKYFLNIIQYCHVSMSDTVKYCDKLELSWAKLSPSWDWTLFFKKRLGSSLKKMWSTKIKAPKKWVQKVW